MFFNLCFKVKIICAKNNFSIDIKILKMATNSDISLVSTFCNFVYFCEKPAYFTKEFKCQKVMFY